ncbi:uncharacterized protein LOC116351063 [Contarinia nasturtii]|uniref:uncharacterized protein LOC116351063 n=1 Tax=Contarinia nasturtii TaxID=265458 RepID=UPI0012D4692A|nr:uncharacterized protein LOC116351063 [Contarinia nasturtii]
MKCCLIVAIICCATTYTVAVDLANQEITQEMMVTGYTCLMKNLNPVTALVRSKILSAGLYGVYVYEQTNSVERAVKSAAKYAFKNAVDMANSALCATTTTFDIVTDITQGRNPRQAVIEHTNIDETARNILNNPKGATAKNIIQKTNIIITWAYGPIPGFVSAEILMATTEGLKKYNQTGNMKEATKAAAKHAIKGVAKVFKLIFGLTKSGVCLSLDLIEGIDPSRAVRQRSLEAIGALVD